MSTKQDADAVFEAASVAARLRQAWNAALCFAISQCNHHDAAQIMTAALEDMETTGPEPAFGPIRADAEWWAETAPTHEVQEYVHAGMKRLGKDALGISARKRLILPIWHGLPATDKRAFIAKVSQ